MKKFWKILLIVLAVLLAAVVLLFAWLTITEYRPDPVTELDVVSSEEGSLIPSDRELSIMSWNIGYAGLGEDSDFFMDGGTGVQSADKEQVLEYLGGVEDVLDDMWPDLIMLQEVDVDSTRTYHIDESAMLAARRASTHSTIPAASCPIPCRRSAAYTAACSQQRIIRSTAPSAFPCRVRSSGRSARQTSSAACS